MTGPGPNRGGWAWRSADAELEDRTLVQRATHEFGRALSADGPTWQAALLAALALAIGLGWSLASDSVEVDVFPTWAPADAANALQILWQVQAAVVGLSIPLLVLLMERAGSTAVLATTATQAMVSETWVVFTTALALGSVVEIGVIGLYMPSDGALIACLVLSSGVVLLILRGYWRSLALFISPEVLRARSERLLLKRLERSVHDDFVTALANDHLAEALIDWRPTRISQDAIVNKDEWTVVLAPSDGLVVDAQIDALRKLLTRLVPPVGVGDANDDTDGVPATGISWAAAGQRTGRLLLTPIGERVKLGDPFVAVPGQHSDATKRAVLRAFEIDHDAF